jgi:hypothetical protein
MATNKWLEGLKLLEDKKDQLKLHLQAHGMPVYQADTLMSMVNKAISLDYVKPEYNEDQFIDNK